MKRRNGFVSNSSSSSFVVAFPREPKSAKETKEILFPNLDTLDYYDGRHKTMDIAKWVFDDIKIQLGKETKFPEITDEVKMCLRVEGSIEKIIDLFYPNLEEECSDSYWDLHDALEKLQNAILYDDDPEGELLEEIPGAKIYTFVYSDDCGQGHMEHGDIFRNLPHRSQSHH